MCASSSEVVPPFPKATVGLLALRLVKVLFLDVLHLRVMMPESFYSLLLTLYFHVNFFSVILEI